MIDGDSIAAYLKAQQFPSDAGAVRAHWPDVDFDTVMDFWKTYAAAGAVGTPEAQSEPLKFWGAVMLRSFLTGIDVGRQDLREAVGEIRDFLNSTSVEEEFGSIEDGGRPMRALAVLEQAVGL